MIETIALIALLSVTSTPTDNVLTLYVFANSAAMASISSLVAVFKGSEGDGTLPKSAIMTLQPLEASLSAIP